MIIYDLWIHTVSPQVNYPHAHGLTQEENEPSCTQHHSRNRKNSKKILLKGVKTEEEASRFTGICQGVALTSGSLGAHKSCMGKQRMRLDELLVDRGLAETRSQAKRLILAGQVRHGTLRPPQGLKFRQFVYASH